MVGSSVELPASTCACLRPPATGHRPPSKIGAIRTAPSVNSVLAYTISQECPAIVIARQLNLEDVLAALADLFIALVQSAHRQEPALTMTSLRRSISNYLAGISTFFAFGPRNAS
jgi:hypothetical protein